VTDSDLLNIARIGIDAEAFAKSDIGKFLIAKATGEIEAATSDLIDADPGDWQANTETRNKIHVARMFLVWLDEAIQIGRHAHDQILEMDSLN